MGNASQEAPALTTPARSRRTGQGIWASALLVVGLSLAGLAVSAGVLWLQLVHDANTAHFQRMAEVAADQYVSYFNARILELRTRMEAAATAPDSIAAASGSDPNRLQRAGANLTGLMPFADRVEIIPAGAARLDRDAEVPISYAALAVIQRAETEPFVGPEGVKLDNQRNRYYAAHPVHEGGTVTGVLFAALSADYLLEPLQAFEPTAGQVTLEQSFEGFEPVSLLQWGEAGTVDAGAIQVRRQLSIPHWHISFTLDRAALAPVAHLTDLLTAMAVTVGLLLAGVLFAFSSLARRLKHDAGALLEQVSNSLRGRRQQPQRYKLGMFHDLAREIGRMARPAANADDIGGVDPRSRTARSAGAGSRSRSRDARENTQEDTVDDLLDDGGEATGKRKGKDEEKADADEFLEVTGSGPRRPAEQSRSAEPDDNFGIEVTEDHSPLAMGLALAPEIFRAYDIRGITTENLTEDVVYWVGRAFAAEAIEHKQNRVAVGRDGRHSSAPLRDALNRGLSEGGLDVLDIGQVPTPVLYYATHALDTGTGIVITGSHNPPEYNGLKMVIGGVTLAEDRITALRTRIEENRLSEGTGDVENVDVAEQYLERIVDDVVVAQPLKVVVDCGNGVAGVLAPELVSRLGCEVVPLYCDVDGDFPNHHPDPAEPANLEDLITVVKAEKADIGLAFDGDGDRLGVVTTSGEIIWPDKLLMLYAQDIVGRNPGADIIYDVKCSRHLNSLISDLGGRPIMWKTGHSHVKAKLKEVGALLAGEFSGHICFGERWYGFDDALYSAARLLEILGGTESTADELFAQFPVTYSTPELKIKTTEQAKFEVIERLAVDGDFGEGTITTIDGLRVDYPDGWGLIRPSNTSPVLSLRFEADGQEALDRIQDLFQEQLGSVDPALRFR